MRIMLTGGAGFIGSYIARELLELGHEVAAFDAFVRYFDPDTTDYSTTIRDRFAGIYHNIEWFRGDTRNEVEVRRAIMSWKPQRIIHLAAMPLADLSSTHSTEAVSFAVNGTVNILEVIRDVSFVERFVYASSSMVYGDFAGDSVDETTLCEPKDVYGGAKLAGEALTKAFGRRFGIEHVIIRPSAVYGPTDINRRVSGIFIQKALKGEPIEIYGSDTILDFTYVKDTAHGFVLAVTKPEAANQTFNIAHGAAISLDEFVQYIEQIVGKVQYSVIDKKDYRPRRGTLNISKAVRMLGFLPAYRRGEGISECIQYLTGGGLNHANRHLEGASVEAVV